MSLAPSHGKNAVVYCNGHNLTGYLNDFSGAGSAEAAETSVFGLNSKSYIPGPRDATLSAEGLFDGDAGASDAILSAALGSAANSVWTWFPAGAAAVGDDGFGFGAVETSYEVASPVSGVVTVSASAQGSSGWEPVDLLHVLGAETLAGNGAAVDNGAGTTEGGAGYLHVTAMGGTGGPTLTVTLEHSADNVTWTTLGTFDVVSAANRAQRLAITGTVNRYVRGAWSLTGTGPSFTFALAFNRK